MRLHSLLLILLPCVLNALSAFSASANLDTEYEQVRKIAMRDPKVKSAFESANQRLEAKIVEIDPALRGYAKGKTTTPAAHTESVASVKAKPFVKPSSLKPVAPTVHGNTHVIATGDTLSTIAAHYKVTVADMRAANPAVDEKKLQIGEKLAIPGAHHSAAKKAPSKPSAWEQLKSKY